MFLCICNIPINYIRLKVQSPPSPKSYTEHQPSGPAAKEVDTKSEEEPELVESNKSEKVRRQTSEIKSYPRFFKHQVE